MNIYEFFVGIDINACAAKFRQVAYVSIHLFCICYLGLQRVIYVHLRYHQAACTNNTIKACPIDLRGHHGNRPNKVLEEYKDKVTCYYLFDNETSSPSLL